MTEHPITPPEATVLSLRNSAPHRRGAGVTRELWLINHAYAAGADHELEACCEWVSENCPYYDDYSRPEDKLRPARRPKPLRLKERALNELDALDNMGTCNSETIRRALEALPND